MLFMADDTTLAVLRRQLEVQLAGRASLVTALHGMLEVIPLGASKAVGLQRVLAMLGVHEAAVLAAGDGTRHVPCPWPNPCTRKGQVQGFKCRSCIGLGCRS